MSLTPDNCQQAFVDAMRPIAKENVDMAAVKANLGALGFAVLTIATQHAQPVSDVGTDATFWQWIQDIEKWLQALSQWQTGVAQAFANWAPTQVPDVSLKTALQGVPGPGAPPPSPPASLTGKIL